MLKRGALKASGIRILVLDEADALLGGCMFMFFFFVHVFLCELRVLLFVYGITCSAVRLWLLLLLLFMIFQYDVCRSRVQRANLRNLYMFIPGNSGKPSRKHTQHAQHRTTPHNTTTHPHPSHHSPARAHTHTQTLYIRVSAC